MNRKSITLPIGKTVNPFFDQQNNIMYIKISPNMTASLFNNKVVDDQSILELEEVVLLSKYRKETVIPVETVRSLSNDTYCLYVKKGIKINRGRIVQPRCRK